MLDRLGRRRVVPLTLSSFLAILALSIAACTNDSGSPAEIRTSTPEPNSDAGGQTPGGDDQPNDSEPTPEPPPTETVQGMSCEERGPLREQLAADVADALEGYNGEWGFALYDLACDEMSTANPNYVQYAASASKIVSAIAVVRAVQEGEVALEAVEPHIDEVFNWSSDIDAFALEEFIAPEDLSAVIRDAGASDASYTEGAWNYTFMTAPDMARVWASLVRGELLDEEWTQYLLDKTGLAEIPEGLETFPDAGFSLPGFQYGQKAGYYVIDGPPLHFVGAGFLIEEDGGPEQFIPVILLRTMNPEFLDPQRREVWPLVVEHIATVTDTELPPPEEIGPGP